MKWRILEFVVYISVFLVIIAWLYLVMAVSCSAFRACAF